MINALNKLSGNILDQFWEKLVSSRSAALLLDYDGTLAPFRVERDQAVPYPGVREKLVSIRQNTATRIVIISGRAIDDLLPLLNLEPAPEIWGSHGWEQLKADGNRSDVKLPKPAQQGLDKALLRAEEQGMAELSEAKPASLAIHWRGRSTDQIKKLRTRVLADWEPYEINYGLEIHSFNGGLELRCPGRNKGSAIESILSELHNDEPVAFLGDDLTDEDGFGAIKNRGLGVLVCCDERQTQADLKITPPVELINFLEKWHISAPHKEVQR